MEFKETGFIIGDDQKNPDKAERIFSDFEIGAIADLKAVLNRPADKLVSFGGGNETEEILPSIEPRISDLPDLSSRWRRYLDPAASLGEKRKIFREIDAERKEIISATGAVNVIFSDDGGISLIHADGRQEKIFDNFGSPVIGAGAAGAENFLSVPEVIGEAKKEKEFRPEDFNIPGAFVDAGAAAVFAKDSGYLDLSRVASLSAEVLRALRPRTGIISLLGLEPENVDNEAREILKSFAGRVLLKDGLKRIIDESG
jgi:hypothetical protein